VTLQNHLLAPSSEGLWSNSLVLQLLHWKTFAVLVSVKPVTLPSWHNVLS